MSSENPRDDNDYSLGSLKQLLESDASAPEGKENAPSEIVAAVGILCSPMGINIMVPDMDSLMKILDGDKVVFETTLGCLSLFFKERMAKPRDAAQHLATTLLYVMTHFDMNQGETDG